MREDKTKTDWRRESSVQIDRRAGEIEDLRKALHEIPELAFEEKRTKELLMSWVKKNTSLEIVDCGSYFYAYYEADPEAKTIAFRADFDAVCGKDGMPGHYCGHDGHAAILAGFGRILTENPPSVNVLLLFQPAEETGEGAKLCREVLVVKHVDEIYGFHNIPGYEKNGILILDGTFACASTGLEIRVMGSPSHAAYPEAGKNPAEILARLILRREEYLAKVTRGLAQITVIGEELGSSSYGVAASEGVLRLTVRAAFEEEFQKLIERICEDARTWAQEAKMSFEVKRIEEFPATENHASCVDKVTRAAQECGFKIMKPAEPFRWSEDFGYYLQKVPGAFFGIGDGEDWPQLHTEEYEFPDEIIETALKMWEGICDEY